MHLEPGELVQQPVVGDVDHDVDRVEQVSKSSFPTQAVYGNTAGAAIRLITCGGTFDAGSGNYEDNIIVFGSLVSLST